MKLFKEVIRKVALTDSISSIKEILKGFVESSGEELADFSGKIDDLVLAQAVRVLREKKVPITPEAIEDFSGLCDLIKSLKEVKDDKNVLCRAANPGK